MGYAQTLHVGTEKAMPDDAGIRFMPDTVVFLVEAVALMR